MADRHATLTVFYSQFLQPGALAFDVGAYHGSRVAAFRANGARVVAIEPVKESVRVLFARFHADPLVTIVPRALGDAAGETDLMWSAPYRFSSTTSPAYTEAAERCGRYGPRGVTSWEPARRVAVTTFDALIAKYGAPAFAKIDVEGAEDTVLRGLTQPVAALSFEFHPHFLAPALDSIEQLARLGRWEMNLCVEEQFRWEMPRWVTSAEMTAMLHGYAAGAPFLYGDIYARLITPA